MSQFDYLLFALKLEFLRSNIQIYVPGRALFFHREDKFDCLRIRVIVCLDLWTFLHFDDKWLGRCSRRCST